MRELYPFVEFFVQPSDFRCYTNDEYEYLDIPLKEDLQRLRYPYGSEGGRQENLDPGKTYLFFAHVAKKQPHNREMFREMSEKNISLIDYEYLTTDKGETGGRLRPMGRDCRCI
ncbi:MAG: hypothetical protein MZV63_04375 [Marinilabiliales bacterium]|nr:hypothetical protein [Marinilabiliales bacterium]